ncbi:MAG TPA: RnfABCDGE type electron transport complex subunit D [Flavobacteriales bacterium]|nr:RnfABCDGE type electron transport complex subunit D [Flavobacteriales bacterium]
MQPIIAFLRRDARHFQILFLAGFLAYGIAVLQWDAEWQRYLMLFGTCLVVQTAFIRWKKLPWHSIKSAMVTGLGMSLLLKAGAPWVLALGAAVAIASKFIIRIEGKHVFNPGNLGIAAAVLLTGQAWVSPGQWGSGATLVFLVGAAGCMVVLRVGRIDTSLAFLGAFAALDFARQVFYLGWEPEVWLHRMSNGSLLLFTFFMITDPMTTPKAQGARIGWSIAIAMLAFVLGWKYWVNATPIWALLIVSAITPVLDRVWKGESFRWLKASDQAPINIAASPQMPNPHR